ncbi:MAG TPA: PEP-CTERM sorting domain-containing protein [Gemmatimonadales bacterium]|nr:PEP-CTERM sorting domain-containing protein [Gemmatimonadales bacterium]
MRREWARLRFASILIGLGVLSAAPQAQATTTYTLTQEFSGSGAGNLSSTIAPTVTIQDNGSGTVTITMAAHFTTTSPFIDEIYMNFVPDTSVGSLSISQNSGPTATVSQSTDFFRPDGDGFFDILFDFPQSGNRFDNTDTAVFTITCSSCSPQIGESSFTVLSEAGPGNTSNDFWHVAAHIQGLGASANQSGFYGDGNGGGGTTQVPAPTALVLLGAGLLGLNLLRRRA